MPTDQSLTERLVFDIEQSELNEVDIARAATQVLDWLACASQGKKSEAGRAFAALAENQSTGKCTLIGGQATSLSAAVQHNAALGHVLEMDDLHRRAILHPGPVIIPAALAVAEQFDCSMDDFLTAIVKGYEITIRLGMAIGRSHYQYFHTTSTCGSAGAAMATASLLSLSAEQTVWALGNAISKSGGLWQMRNEQVLTKSWHNSEAAHAGMMAALLAKQGLSGPSYILEGPQGMFNALSQAADPAVFVAAHPHWHIHDCSLKPWPSCRHAHPAMDALGRLITTHGFTAGQVDSIDVGVYQDALVFCDRPTPQDELQAKFSIQHALAAILLYGEPKLEHYQPSYFNNPACAALRKRIQLHSDDGLENHYPNHFGATCTVTLKDRSQHHVEISDTLGDPEHPMTSEQLEQKVRMLMGDAGFSERNINSLCQYSWKDGPDMTPLTQMIRSTEY